MDRSEKQNNQNAKCYEILMCEPKRTHFCAFRIVIDQKAEAKQDIIIQKRRHDLVMDHGMVSLASSSGKA